MMYELVYSPDYPTYLLAQLKELYNNGTLCDFCLVSGGKEIWLHSAVLFSVSLFFKSMLDKGLVTGTVLQIKAMDSECLQMVVQYMYSGCLSLSSENVKVILSQVTYFDIPEAMILCQRFIDTNLALSRKKTFIESVHPIPGPSMFHISVSGTDMKNQAFSQTILPCSDTDTRAGCQERWSSFSEQQLSQDLEIENLKTEVLDEEPFVPFIEPQVLNFIKQETDDDQDYGVYNKSEQLSSSYTSVLKSVIFRKASLKPERPPSRISPRLQGLPAENVALPPRINQLVNRTKVKRKSGPDDGDKTHHGPEQIFRHTKTGRFMKGWVRRRSQRMSQYQTNKFRKNENEASQQNCEKLLTSATMISKPKASPIMEKVFKVTQPLEKKHKCSICGVAFSWYSFLSRHYKSHCNVGYMQAQTKHLTKQAVKFMTTHQGMSASTTWSQKWPPNQRAIKKCLVLSQTYTCQYCKHTVKFRNSKLLYLHYYHHHYKALSDLSKLKVKHPECYMCLKQYLHEYNWRRHLQWAHVVESSCSHTVQI